MSKITFHMHCDGDPKREDEFDSSDIDGWEAMTDDEKYQCVQEWMFEFVPCGYDEEGGAV